MTYLRTLEGRVPLRSEWLQERGRRYFTANSTSMAEWYADPEAQRQSWLAHRFVYHLTRYAAKASGEFA